MKSKWYWCYMTVVVSICVIGCAAIGYGLFQILVRSMP